MRFASTGAVALHPLVLRVLAPNPSPFTHTGTQGYVVGDAASVAVIDPGPDDARHRAALLRAIDGRAVRAILCTHNHRDHSPGAAPLAAETGAPVVGCAPLAVAGDAAFDTGYAPDAVLADGERVEGDGWSLQAVATPGHTSNHLAFALPQAQALFSGDHVMGWSTSIVSPPDGDMGAYMASLERLLGRDDAVYYPGHGDAVEQPQRWVRSMLGHRRAREGQILRLLGGGDGLAVPAMAARMYAGIEARLLPAAERSTLAHLIELGRRGEAAEREGLWHRS